MSLFLSITLWTLIGAITAYLANQRGRDPYAWFAIGILLGVFGMLILLILPPFDAGDKEIQNKDEIINITPAKEKDIATVEWFCLDKMRKQQGPLVIEALKMLWKSGSIDVQSYVWSEGMNEWKRIGEIPSLLELLQK